MDGGVLKQEDELRNGVLERRVKGEDRRLRASVEWGLGD